jgi:hypothetical protein
MVVQSIGIAIDLRDQNRNISSVFVVTGVTTQGDGRGGTFWWDATSVLPDDGISVIQVTGVATGRWVKISDKFENYVHDQPVASATWIVNHNLGKFASVSIVDTANDEVIGDVTYNGLNQITINFSSAVSGKAYIN